MGAWIDLVGQALVYIVAARGVGLHHDVGHTLRGRRQRHLIELLVVHAIQRCDTRRIIVVQAFGVGEYDLGQHILRRGDVTQLLVQPVALCVKRKFRRLAKISAANTER